jgi:hypothetical protein
MNTITVILLSFLQCHFMLKREKKDLIILRTPKCTCLVRACVELSKIKSCCIFFRITVSIIGHPQENSSTRAGYERRSFDPYSRDYIFGL